ncbi:MAG: hypothetical protein K1Y02_06830 [Candidatus Hydrogenedentes bacterium]|nr:hypothetical protein [Candidatus Hydrogenedentota bacterium]
MSRHGIVNGRTYWLLGVCATLQMLVAGVAFAGIDFQVAAGDSHILAAAKVEYVDLLTKTLETKRATTQVAVTDSRELAQAGENADVMECVVAQLATETNESAVRLRDTGQVQQSRQVLEENARVLRENAAKYNSQKLESLGKTNSDQANQVADPQRWKALRKSMTKGQYDIKQQTGK